MRLKQANPPERLFANILAEIELHKKRAARTQSAFFGLAAAVSLIAMVPAVQYAISAFQQSGFSSYSSLLFTDSGLIFVNFREFALTLAESAPLLEITLVLSIVFILLESVKITAKNIKLV